MNTIMIELPKTLEVEGLKHHDESLEVDLEGKSVEWFEWALAFAMRQSPGDADAGKTDLPDEARRKLVRAKFDRIASGEVPSSGSGGGGKRITTQEEATRDVVESLLIEHGKASGLAKKASTAKDRWNAVALQILSRKLNRVDVPAGDIQVFLDKNQERFDEMVKDRIAELNAIKERAKGISSKLDFDIS